MSPSKKPATDIKGSWLKIRVTDDRLKRWKEAAAQAKASEDDDDLDFSAWARRALNRAEKEEEEQRKKGKRR